MNTSIFKRALLIGPVLLLVAACGALSSEEVEFPYGSYASRGGRHIEFTEDGTWSFALVAGNPVVTGDITVDGREITFGDETPAEGQNVPTCEEHATYTWSYEDEALTFEPVGEEPCGHRASDLGATFFPAE